MSQPCSNQARPIIGTLHPAVAKPAMSNPPPCRWASGPSAVASIIMTWPLAERLGPMTRQRLASIAVSAGRCIRSTEELTRGNAARIAPGRPGLRHGLCRFQILAGRDGSGRVRIVKRHNVVENLAPCFEDHTASP